MLLVLYSTGTMKLFDFGLVRDDIVTVTAASIMQEACDTLGTHVLLYVMRPKQTFTPLLVSCCWSFVL
jgi:hypothetical protein